MPRGKKYSPKKKYYPKKRRKSFSWKKTKKSKGTVVWKNNRLMIVGKRGVFTSYVKVGPKWIYLGEYNTWKGARSVFYKRLVGKG